MKGVLLGDYIIACPRQRDKSMGLSEQPHRETKDERLTSVLREGLSGQIRDQCSHLRHHPKPKAEGERMDGQVVLPAAELRAQGTQLPALENSPWVAGI